MIILIPCTVITPAWSDPLSFTEEELDQAKQLYEQRCTRCHGRRGRGDGPFSKNLTPRPRDLSSPRWQESVDDKYIKRVIIGGGGAVGKSILMPSNPDLRSNPKRLKALIYYLRQLAVKK